MTYHESLRVTKVIEDRYVTQAVNVDTRFNPLPSVFVTELRENDRGEFIHHGTVNHQKGQAGRLHLFPEVLARIRAFELNGIDLTTGEPAAPRTIEEVA